MTFNKGNKPWNKGIKYTQEIKNKMNLNGLTIGCQKGERHHLWKGDKASKCAIHYWLYRQVGKAKKCVKCGSEKYVEWANISGKYMRNIDDFMQLCRKCHAHYDNYVNKAWETRSAKYV